MSKFEGAMDELTRTREYVDEMLKLTANHPDRSETNIAGAEPYYNGIRQAYESVLRYLDNRMLIWTE